MKKVKYLLPLTLFLLTSCELQFPIFGSEHETLPTERPSESTSDTDSSVSTSDSNSEEITSSVETSTTEESSDTEEEGPTSDPYVGVSSYEFYKNYQPATNYWDSYYRTQHNFMSGSIVDQKQRPTIASNQPKVGDKYVKNVSSGLRSNGLAYDIVDANGNVVNTVFKGGAYITLEEVAAYVFAFGDVPSNYTADKKMKPTVSPWGKYLRVNNNYYSNDPEQYPTEPELPNGSDLTYYEIDIGTTGSYEYSDGYTPKPYNNGSYITRGASRIVYSKFSYSSGKPCEDPSVMKVFYTFDHYRDFQEYLNYEGGWGKWFGNIAGGASVSDKTGKYKTSYPSVVEREF